MDDGALCSIAELPDETPSLEFVFRTERRVYLLPCLLRPDAEFLPKKALFELSYVWLIDSLAVLRYQGIDDAGNYNGLMKLNPSIISQAWFEKVSRFGSENWAFDRYECLDGSGNKWYQAR